MDETQIIIILICLAVMIGVIMYFIPSIVAFRRDTVSRWGIFLVNIFFGWTLLIWIITLIWACEGRTKNNYKYIGGEK